MKTTTRRTFMKQCAVAGAPFILPSHIWSAETSPNSKPQVGVVGVGGHGHAFMYNASKVVAISDVDPEHAAKSKQRALPPMMSSLIYLTCG